MDERLPAGPQPSQVSIKTVLTVCFTVLGVGAVLYVVFHAHVALTLAVMAALVAVALHHAVEWLMMKGLRRRLAIGLVIGGLFAALAGIGLVLIPPAVSQGQALVRQGPELMEKARSASVYRKLDDRFDLDEKLETLRARAPQLLPQAVDPAIKAITGVLATLGGIAAVIFTALLMLLFGAPMVHALLNETLPERRARYQTVLGQIYRSIGGYLTGLSLVCLTNAAATTTLLAVIRVPFFLPLGLLSGLSSLLPMVGNTLAGIFITLVALATGGLWKGVTMGVFFLVYQQFENHVLGPLVYRRTVNMNPAVLAVALLAFAEMGGVVGAILAVPTVAIAQIILREVLRMRREQLAARGVLVQKRPEPPPRRRVSRPPREVPSDA